jgi:DNA primase small subunit
VKPIKYEKLDGFDPLEHAIPDRFRGRDIKISAEGMENQSVELGGETFTISDGINIIPEYAAMFLMTRGKAEKVKESKN